MFCEIFFSGGGKTEPALSGNPASHKLTRNGSEWDFGSTKVSISRREHDPLRLVVQFDLGRVSRVMSLARALMGPEYPNILDRLVQIIHELVLVPSVFFDPRRAPIHGSAVSIKGSGTVFTGTGGVGKSSALLRLAAAKRNDIAFMADDMPIVSGESELYGNMAYPKIYVYNWDAMPVGVNLLEGRPVLDKLHFHVLRKLNPSKVRRKISPDSLFSASHVDSSLGELLFLFRSDVQRPMFQQLDFEKAAELQLHVMKTEYSIIFNHIEWAEYNAKICGLEPILRSSELYSGWLRVYESAFKSSRNRVLHLPFDYSNDQLDEILFGEFGLNSDGPSFA